MGQTELRTRWETPLARRRAAGAMAALLAGRRPVENAFPSFEGRVDLRGLVVTEPSELRRWASMGMGLNSLERVSDSINLSVTDLARVDFSQCYLPHLRLAGASLVDCRFDDAHLPDFRTRDSDLGRCSFRGAALDGAVFGPRSRFTRCDFGGALLRGVQSDSAAFAECEFGQAQLARDDFNRTTFERCHFAGLVQEVTFRAESWHVDEVTGRPAVPDANCVRDCDFSQARLRSVTFEQLTLKGVRFPDDGEHLALAELRCVLTRLRQRLAGDGSRAARQLSLHVEQQLSALPRSRSHGYLSLADLTESANHGEAETVTGWIREAVAACAKGSGGWLGRLRGGG